MEFGVYKHWKGEYEATVCHVENRYVCVNRTPRSS